MKIQLLERGGKYFLRTYLLGFIPLYWDDCYDGGWQPFRFDIDKVRAEELMTAWVLGYEQKSKFKSSHWKTVKSVRV